MAQAFGHPPPAEWRATPVGLDVLPSGAEVAVGATRGILEVLFFFWD